VTNPHLRRYLEVHRACVAQVDPEPGLVEGPVLLLVERLDAVLRGHDVNSGRVMHAERVTDEETSAHSAQVAALSAHEAHALA
jgi:hypothetical protein